MLKTYIFTATRRDYYKVSAHSKESAKEILEGCDDLTDFYATDECRTFEDLQPEFEYYGEY